MIYRRTRLDSICTIHTGHTTRSRLDSSTREGVPAIQLRDVKPDGITSPVHLTRIRIESIPKMCMVSSGDLVFRSRGWCNEAFVLDERFQKPCLALLPLVILRPDKEIAYPEFIQWTINQPPTQAYFNSVAHGTNMRMVSRTDLARLEFDLPEIKIQRRIVDIDILSRREHALSIAASEARRKLAGMILANCIKTV